MVMAEKGHEAPERMERAHEAIALAFDDAGWVRQQGTQKMDGRKEWSSIWGREWRRVKKDAFEKPGEGEEKQMPGRSEHINPDVEKREGDKTKRQHHAAPPITAARRGQHILKRNDPYPAPRLSGRPADEEEPLQIRSQLEDFSRVPATNPHAQSLTPPLPPDLLLCLNFPKCSDDKTPLDEYKNIQDNAPLKPQKPHTRRVLPVVHREARIPREEERVDELERE
ncbi:hypothetical protein B0H14DRAFT_2643083 [Mycena olivaceomarginata]|nr:hypothetical protein B0H14DRAFT_2643083 [Mycena olivaceomarginata]